MSNVLNTYCWQCGSIIGTVDASDLKEATIEAVRSVTKMPYFGDDFTRFEMFVKKKENKNEVKQD